MNKHWRMLTMSLDDLPKENMVLPTGESISYSDRIHRFIKQNRELKALKNLKGFVYLMGLSKE